MKLKYTAVIFSLLFSHPYQAKAAEDGKHLYKELCSACHGMEGQGMGDGAFPPLKDSGWIKGDPNRVALILLNGLTGPVTVKGKVYNLEMPAQGALSDEGKVAVIRYIKKEFAGEKTDFSIKDLKEAKKAHGSRDKAWTEKELLKLYPIPVEKSSISNLVMHIYDGKWPDIPDFGKLKAKAVEEEAGGYISLKNIKRKTNFGIVWKGDLEVTSDGNYEFDLSADDSAIVSVNGIEVASVRGLGGMNPKRAKKKPIELKKGSHKIEVQYLQAAKQMGILLKWKKLGEKDYRWLTDKSNVIKEPAVVIDLTPKDGRTKMYHNFIKGSTHRTMGVGYPHGQNIAFSTQDCQPDMIWKGKFINAGLHWTGRGQGAQKPSSDIVVELGRGVAWSKDEKDLKLDLIGYTMDKLGNPTFNYKSANNEVTFSEKYTPSEKDLTRVITISSDTDQSLRLRLARGKPVMSDLGALINGKLNIDAENMNFNQGKLYSNIELKKGTNSYKVIYSWKK